MNIVDGVLMSYDSPPKNLVISGVRVIGENALKGADIESVDMRGVVEIRKRAFMDCTSLREVKLPSSLRKIGAFAFSGARMGTMVIPEGVVEIQNRAFMDCSLLREVKLPSSLRKLGTFAFSGTRVDTIELPYAVQLADDVFFDSWLSLVVSDVNIPLYKFPPGCKVVTRAQHRALERLGADGIYKQHEDMLRIRVPRRPRREDDMPRISLRQAMRRAKAPAKPRPKPKPKKQGRAKTPPRKPRSGECTICLKPSCEHLNMSKRLGAPLMW